MKAGNSVLLAAKMVIKNPEEVNAAIENGKQSKEYFHDAQRAVRRIQDHQEIVKEYQKVGRSYNNFMRDYPWMTEDLMQDN